MLILVKCLPGLLLVGMILAVTINAIRNRPRRFESLRVAEPITTPRK